MWTSFNHCRRSSCKPAGFTLIELLVVVGVISIITAFMLFNQGQFNSSTLLRSLAYSVALSVRQAQLYGTSVRGINQPNSTTFAPGYGIDVSSGDLTHYYQFADLNGNGVMDTSPIDERLTATGSGGALVTIGRGYAISKFCGISNTGIQDCYPAAGGGTLSDLTIYFKRPNPDATFAAVCSGTCAGTYVSAYIQVKSSGSNDTRAIKVTNTGQISVCPLNTNPPAC